MAPYIPNATQTTEPVESRTVESAALEFRTLKASINARAEDAQDALDAEIVNRIAGDANLQTQNNSQDVRLTAVENALLFIGEGCLPGTVYVQRLSGTGAQTVFTLNATPQSGNVVDIYINGLYQNKDTFIIAGADVTFSEAPPAGTNNIEVQVTVTIALGETDASLVTYDATTVEAQLDAISGGSGSSLVGFQQSGAGAIVRTAQDKMREWVSVKDFGAVGDGVTDDTAEIQAALNSGAKRVIAPPGGTYRITNMLTIDADGVEFDFNRSTLLLDDATGLKSHLLLGNGTIQRSGICIRNVIFTRAQAATAGYAINSSRIGVTEISGCRIYGDNKIHSGIRVYRGIIVNIVGNYIDNCVNWGLLLEGSGTGGDRTVDVSIRENRIEGGVTALAAFDFVEGIFCRDNIFFNTSGSAVTVNASSNANGLVSFKFQENDFDTCGGAGLFIDKVSNIQITGCWFASITDDALQLKSDCHSVVVSGNQFYPTAVGIRVECPDVRIDNNLISGGTTCVNIAGGTRVGISSNTLQNANVGVDVGLAANIHVVGNLFSGIATQVVQNRSSTTSIQSNSGDPVVGSNSFFDVGASPFTYTAGSRAECISIFGGTVTNIQLGSTSIGFGTDRTVVLAPNQSVTVTYSSVPYMVKNIL